MSEFQGNMIIALLLGIWTELLLILRSIPT